MAKDLILMAEPRTALAKQNKALRRTGRVPGVVYGPEVESTIQVSVDRRELERFYLQVGLNFPFTLKWDGGSADVVIREVQVEPVRHAPLHVDFYVPKKS
jgi:large subunit ribosomal protein L25